MEENQRLTGNEILREIISTILYVVVIFAVVFLIITYVGQRTRVDGHSMEPSLSDGDNLIMDKISYRFRDPQRFDVIIFPVEFQENTYYIKRIIGLPGETVQIDADGNIYIDGEILQEDYGKERILSAGIASRPIVLGEDEYFVLGDNRNNSMDSRFKEVGPSKRADIIGRAWVRIYPFDQIGFVKHQG